MQSQQPICKSATLLHDLLKSNVAITADKFMSVLGSIKVSLSLLSVVLLAACQQCTVRKEEEQTIKVMRFLL